MGGGHSRTLEIYRQSRSTKHGKQNYFQQEQDPGAQSPTSF